MNGQSDGLLFCAVVEIQYWGRAKEEEEEEEEQEEEQEEEEEVEGGIRKFMGDVCQGGGKKPPTITLQRVIC